MHKMDNFYGKMTDLAGYARNAAVQATTLVAGSELEKKLTEACSNEPWGASGTMLSELARATFSYDDFKTVMTFVWKNTQLTGSLWRVCYKTLNLLDHLIRNGSDRVIEDARDHQRELKALQKFEFVDPEGKDCGVNVREKAKQIIEILGNDEQLNEERDKARASRNRYTGASARDMGVADASPAPAAQLKGFSDDDFKFAADRGKNSSVSSVSSYMPSTGLSSYMSGAFSTVSEYAQVRSSLYVLAQRAACGLRDAPAHPAHTGQFPPLPFFTSSHVPPTSLVHLAFVGCEQADAVDVDAVPIL